MSSTIIKANPGFKKSKKPGVINIDISEMFADTIQGENFMGYPATFMRMQRCTLDCVFCDSNEVWREGNPYTIEEILDLWEDYNLPYKFKLGQRLVLTGGSPLAQQKKLTELIRAFDIKYGFIPYIEIENECTLMPTDEMIEYVSCWNNSPKLENSQNNFKKRYKPDVLKKLSSLENSWFKFVVTKKEDWEEIEEDFLKPHLIDYNQVILMPEGQTREELEKTRMLTVDLAIENNVRFSDRLHIILWDKKTGV